MYRKPSTYSPNALIEERLKEWRSASTTKRSSPISVGDFSRRSRSPSNSDSPLYQHPGLSFRVKYPNRTVSTKWSLYSAGFETKFLRNFDECLFAERLPLSSNRASPSNYSGYPVAHISKPDDSSMSRRPDNSMSNEQSASIGLLLEQHNVTREIFVKSLMPGGPAHRDGRLQEGDQLLSVDSFVVQGQKLSAVFEMIKGIPGTKVTPTFHDQYPSSPPTLF